jgi:hypothetical protein
MERCMMNGDRHLAQTVMCARTLFRKHVWMQVACIMTEKVGNRVVSGMRPTDLFKSLHMTNRNAVKLAATAAALNAPGAAHGCPLCVVVLSVDMASHNGSADSINKIVQAAVWYGNILPGTHVVIQICFRGLLYDRVGMATEPAWADEAVSLVVLDNVGMAGGYNIPPGSAGSVAYQCVARLLLHSLGQEPSMIVHTVKYQQRTLCDDYLYAMYITVACAEASSALPACSRNRRDTDMNSCRMSSRYARPTRIISNLRFLMFLQVPGCAGVVSDLLLDEVNTLDSVRRVTQGVACTLA